MAALDVPQLLQPRNNRPPPKMSQQSIKILTVETMPVDLDSGLPADTYVHSQVDQDGIKQPAFYNRTRYLFNWSADET